MKKTHILAMAGLLLVAAGGIWTGTKIVGQDPTTDAPHAAADEPLHQRAGESVYTCPMHPSVRQSEPGSCPICGMDLVEVEPEPEPMTDPDAVAHHTCPMHPSVKQSEPGSCPICGMDLEPVLQSEVSGGVVLIDAVRRQTIGVRTAPVTTGSMTRKVRAVGHVTYDERDLADVDLKVKGWIQDLYVDAEGAYVRKGAPLFTFYSPELYAAQKDYLQALRARERATDIEEAGFLLESARERLILWDLTEAQVDSLASRGRAQRYVTIFAPASGHVIAKHVVEGSSVMPGQMLYRIAPLERVWVEAEVYESDLAILREGQRADVRLPFLPGREFEGTIDHIYPYMADGSRTGRVRLVLRNPDLELRPNMYADVELEVDLGRQLRVPQEAVIYTGPRRIVFVDLGEGRLRPTEIQVGRSDGAYFEVLSGLSPGDVVVTSGNFLVAAESRLRSAATFWSAGDGSHEH